MINAKLYLLKDAGRQLKNRTRIRFHIGTAEILARVTILEKPVLNPGESAIVQFRLLLADIRANPRKYFKFSVF